MTIYNEDGRKMTLYEYFKKLENKDCAFEIKSLKTDALLICGRYEYIKEHLAKEYWGICLQNIAEDAYGITLFVR